MLTNKHIVRIVSALTALTVVACLAAVIFADRLVALAGRTGVTMEYESKLFDLDSPLTVNIVMEESEWKEMLSNAMQETYYQCDVQIGGLTVYRVGIRPKGNTSLSSIAMNPDTDRFSFKLEFDRFVGGQNCYGLDKLILNNNYADATNMKEAFVYDMYRYIGADASLYNYAAVYVNGEFWGVYLALEAVEDSFLLRNYGVNSGKLYKPEGMGMGGGKIGAPQGQARPDMMDFGKFGDENPKNMDFGGFSAGGSGGANLNYTDDNPDSYSTIWEGEITETKEADHRRVVKALKNISEGTGLEKSMDIDNLLRYMAVHVFSVNSDSLSGNMAHNYYLYEKDGMLNLIPWDYNLILGGMGGGGDASSVINDAIDGAFSGTEFFDSLMENETYYDEYHAYLRELVDAYINGGAFDAFYARTRGILDELVETDPTAFYTYEEYCDAADTFYEVVKLRGESVSGQLDGTIPSTRSGQQKEGGSLIDTGNLDLSIMGSMDMNNGDMGGGGGFQGFGGGFRFGGGFVGGSGFAPPQTDGEMMEGGTPTQLGALPGGGDRPQFEGGQPGGFDPAQFEGGQPGGFDPAQFEGGQPGGFDPSQFEGGQPGGFDPAQFEGGQPGGFDPSQFEGGQPEGFDRPQFDGKAPGAAPPAQGNGGNAPQGEASAVTKNLIAYGSSFLILLLALVFAMRFRPKSRWR